MHLELPAPTPLFFQAGWWGLRPFFHFHFFRGADAPTTLTDRGHPLPPHAKFEYYFLWITRFADKRLQVVDFIRHSLQLTDNLQNPFNTMSIMLTQNQRKYYKRTESETQIETSWGNCG
jgi:hypothetical protein